MPSAFPLSRRARAFAAFANPADYDWDWRKPVSNDVAEGVLSRPIETWTTSDMARVMGADCYHESFHRNHKQATEKVYDWFKWAFPEDPAERDQVKTHWSANPLLEAEDRRELDATLAARHAARALTGMGRYGDTILAHLTPEEARFLHEVTDGGSINPKTGLLEFWQQSDSWSDSGGWNNTGVGSWHDDTNPGGQNDGDYNGSAVESDNGGQEKSEGGKPARDGGGRPAVLTDQTNPKVSAPVTGAPKKDPAAEFADAERRHQRALAAWQAEEETKQKQREEAERQAKAKQRQEAYDKQQREEEAAAARARASALAKDYKVAEDRVLAAGKPGLNALESLAGLRAARTPTDRNKARSASLQSIQSLSRTHPDLARDLHGKVVDNLTNPTWDMSLMSDEELIERYKASANPANTAIPAALTGTFLASRQAPLPPQAKLAIEAAALSADAYGLYKAHEAGALEKELDQRGIKVKDMQLK
ncbi:hypothetical protein [Magnetospira sp. QH-2]|uniref:hypothetical protein n=1 Tax=Magnetospira sp. (strain QH-2) TaxID=1288970 RepID=UPI0003E8137D|nr:hypothetical protein [Magnetospira sp. QH-2]CCQ72003.1 protein of unknown function [Magnetospira sp. QH-2]